LASWTYQAKGLSVAFVSLTDAIPGVFIDALNRIELVITGDFDAAALALERRRGDAIGEVWALAPLQLVGEAHNSLRGRVDRLVPWWIDGTIIKFGNPRIP